MTFRDELFATSLEQTHKWTFSRLQTLLKLWTYMDTHMCLQISGFNKGTIAKKERTADWRALFFARPHNFVVTKIETQPKMFYWVVIVLNLDDLPILVTSLIVLLGLFLRANAEDDVGLTKNKIL